MSIELQNAFEISKAERRAAHADSSEVEAIGEHLARGRFVLVAEEIAYCSRTDAAIGFDQIFQSAHDSREEAIAAEAARAEEEPSLVEVLRILAPRVYGCESRPEVAPF